MDARLRAAVDASVAWYDDVFALHDLPTRTEAGLWWALERTIPWHSSVKTTEPRVDVARVLAVHTDGAVADSFGDLDLRPHGFELLIDATWVHHLPLSAPVRSLPPGWTVVADPIELEAWNQAHDYTEVLLPAVLDRPAFTVLARHSSGVLDGGAVVHRSAAPGCEVVDLSNAWADGRPIDHTELLAVVAALHPGLGVTGYDSGADLAAMLAAGYVVLGPQRVWLPESAEPVTSP